MIKKKKKGSFVVKREKTKKESDMAFNSICLTVDIS
jgi:hypothetical protein